MEVRNEIPKEDPLDEAKKYISQIPLMDYREITGRALNDVDFVQLIESSEHNTDFYKNIYQFKWAQEGSKLEKAMNVILLKMHERMKRNGIGIAVELKFQVEREAKNEYEIAHLVGTAYGIKKQDV